VRTWTPEVQNWGSADHSPHRRTPPGGARDPATDFAEAGRIGAYGNESPGAREMFQ
jgi:hypothetical protein